VQLERKAGHEYVVGVDWGKYEDYTVFSVIDVTLGEQCYVERMNMIDYRRQLPRLMTVNERFQPYEIVAESNMSEKMIEDMYEMGMPVTRFQTGSKNKQEIIEALQVGIEKKELLILDHEVQMGEMQAFIATRLPGGGIRYSAPEGYHDDCVMALALAWSAGRHGAIDIEKQVVGRKPVEMEVW
jgi:hypothetical protein